MSKVEFDDEIRQEANGDHFIPLSMVKVSVRTDNTEVTLRLWALMTPYGIVQPLLEYCLEHMHDRSLRWKSELVHSVKLFLAYLNVHATVVDRRSLLRGFAQRLYTGTFDSMGWDRTCLGWLPNPKQAPRFLGYLSGFLSWLVTRGDSASLFAPASHGLIEPDAKLREAAYQHARDNSLLGHTWPVRAADSRWVSSQRIYGSARSVSSSGGLPKAFPESRFVDLLTHGFKVGNRYDLRSMLISTLQHGAGVRESEPFHMYVSDVMPDPLQPSSALVLLHHPVLGLAPDGWASQKGTGKVTNRAAYLREVWGIPPRNELLGSKHSGWKGGEHEEAGGSIFFRAHWFEPQYGELFLALWLKYMHDLMRIPRTHPFAFVNTMRAPYGEMYSKKQYEKAHARAVMRVGLMPAKHLGTTTHGHRHAYGQRLRAAGIDKEMRRRLMHHSSLSSQDVYTQPSDSEIRAELTAAAQRMRPNGKSYEPSIAEFISKLSYER